MTVTVNFLARLSTQAYDNWGASFGQGNATKVVVGFEGFTRVTLTYDELTNFYAEAWKNPTKCEIFIVDRGTEFSSPAANGVIDTRDAE